MFTEPLTLPQDLGDGSTTKVEPVRINQDAYTSEYLVKATLSEHRVRIRHSVVNATANKPQYDRHNVEVVETVYATATAAQFDRKVYIVFENLPGDEANVDLNIHGLCTFVQLAANMSALLNWES